MGFSRIRLGEDIILETKIFDETYRQIGNWKVMKKDFPATVKIIFNQLGINAKVVDKTDKENVKQDRDLDWLK